jgi:hypothetical protein
VTQGSDLNDAGLRITYPVQRSLPWQCWPAVISCKYRRMYAMTIHLSKDLERFVRDAVQTGRYASEDDVIRDALARLKETLPKNTKTPAK